MQIKRKTVLNILLVALVLVIVGANLYTNIARARGNTLPMPFGIGTAVINSGSMEPNLPIDSLIVVMPAFNYKVGDIVAYQTERGKIHTVHRIVSIDGDTVVTAGDNNGGSLDPAITKDMIKGKVVLHIPGLGRGLDDVSDVLQNPIVTLLILLAAGVLLFFSMRSDKKTAQTDATDPADSELDAIRAEIERLKNEQAPAENTPDTPSDSTENDNG